MTTAYVFPSLATAQALAPVVDASVGLPAFGTDVGAGLHVIPTAQTLTYAMPIKHPTLALWAYPADARINQAVLPNAVTLGIPAPTVLDASWTGATPVLPAVVAQAVVVGP